MGFCASQLKGLRLLSGPSYHQVANDGGGEQNGHQRRAACGWEVGWGAGALGGTGAKNGTKTKIPCLIFGVVNTPGGVCSWGSARLGGVESARLGGVCVIFFGGPFSHLVLTAPPWYALNTPAGGLQRRKPPPRRVKSHS